MKNIDFMARAMEMLELPEDDRKGIRNLRRGLPKMVEYLLLESLDGGEADNSWVEESISLLRPDDNPRGQFNYERMIPIYENSAKVYDFIRLNGLVETDNMKRIRDYLAICQRHQKSSEAKEIVRTK